MINELLQSVREEFHPLYRARKCRLSRLLIRAADRRAWISLPLIDFPVRGLVLTHKIAYGLNGPQERVPQRLALASLRHFKFRTFWDVGANFGYYSWLLKSAAPELEVNMVEPLPANISLIRATIERNALSKVTLIEAAAGECHGEGLLHVDELGGSTSSLSDEQTFERVHFGITAPSVEVRIVAIDSLQPKQIDFIKIDVEGYEAAALRGARRSIASDQPVLFIECCHPGHRCTDVLENYEIVDADTLSRNCAEGSTNFFCFPRRCRDSVDAILQEAAQ